MDADKAYGEKARRQLLKNVTSYIEQILEATSHKTAAVRPPTTHYKIHPNKMNKTCGTLPEDKQGQTQKWRPPMDLFTRTSKCYTTS